MRSALWPDCTSEHNVADMHAYLNSGGSLTTFVAADSEGSLRGFVEASLRPSAEGCTTSPIGYLEGIYVEPLYRRRGLARMLVAAVERWAASKGCIEFASDCLADNDASILFHRSVGFDAPKKLFHFRRGIPYETGKP